MASFILGELGLKISSAEIFMPICFISASLSSVGIHIPPLCWPNENPLQKSAMSVINLILIIFGHFPQNYIKIWNLKQKRASIAETLSFYVLIILLFYHFHYLNIFPGCDFNQISSLSERAEIYLILLNF